MDMRGDHRRPKVVEEPRRTPWLPIILLALAAIGAGSILSQLDIRLDRAQPEPPDVVLVPAPPPPPAIEASGDLTTGAPRWAVQPRPEFPASALSQSEGRVELDCVIQSDLALGDCRILEETPEGYGFGKAALEGVRRARVSGEDAAGKRVQFGVNFRLAD